ncbi:MAG: type II toxin-antitoxin system RelE/ParE family toxin [Rhizobiales bacterium]|nr:type II toxin-antitoxin system RelE/ParE family toxin [Hyphomicrobiales bacterium]
MIESFKDKITKAIFEGKRVKKLPEELQRKAERKLIRIDTAHCLEDLSVPPGNKLEALSGDRKGQHSIRVNDQWRICFVWGEDGVYEVEFVDYH